MCTARKLEDVRRDLTPLAEQGNIVGFLTNVEGAKKINGLVEDLRELIMDYQVCVLELFVYIISNVYARLHCNKISTTRVASSLWVSLPCLSPLRPEG